jgi:hypothetical protein
VREKGGIKERQAEKPGTDEQEWYTEAAKYVRWFEALRLA